MNTFSRRFIGLLLSFILVISSAVFCFADSETTSKSSRSQEEQIAKEVMISSLSRENARLALVMTGVSAKGERDFNSYTNLKASVKGNGVHIASRRSQGSNYNEIQTKFELGANIGAEDSTAVYFMHYLGGSNVSVDSGIFYGAGSFHIFHYGSIKATNNWDDYGNLNIEPGDVVYVNTKLEGQTITTSVKKNGKQIATLTNNLSKKYSGKGVQVVREFNIAGHKPINNTNTYFSWSNAQSSMVTTGNVLKQMSASNSYLEPIRFENGSEAEYYNHLGYGRDAYSSNGYIYDKAWCRCNYK